MLHLPIRTRTNFNKIITLARSHTKGFMRNGDKDQKLAPHEHMSKQLCAVYYIMHLRTSVSMCVCVCTRMYLFLEMDIR